MRIRMFPDRILLMLIVGVSFRAFTQTPQVPPPLSERIVEYQIAATLDDRTKTIIGRQSIVWKNTTKDRVSELQFHLYLNGFKNSETTLMKESDGVLRGSSMGEKDYGWTNIIELRTAAGVDLMKNALFIQPDDENPADQTVLRVPLAQAVAPGKTIKVELQFEARLPALTRRTGYSGNYYMIGQWFPKLGVYEPAEPPNKPRGGWNCHQFHASSEFFADYGVYDVRLTVPEDFVVGATGILTEEVRHDGDSTKTLRFQAYDVHDFAWTASPRYRIVESKWNNVTIKLMTEEHRIGEISDRYIQATKEALAYFGEWLMPYPYPVITVVDPPFRGDGAAGMEYPTLITGWSLRGLPSGFRFTEMATIHEFGHQYWYGMVGNNEFEEAWLDEGLNQYSETRIMDHVYGKSSSFADLSSLKIGDFAFTRTGYVSMRTPMSSPITVSPWSMAPGTSGSLSYNKTAVMLATLEGMVGRQTMDEVLRTFFQRWKFRHPKERDFREIASDVVHTRHGNAFGEDLDWYFDQVLDGTEICDYEVTSLSSQKLLSAKGNMSGLDTAQVRASRGARGEYESRILVTRKGGVRIPVDILVRFADGSVARERWDGNDRWRLFKYLRTSEAVEAIVDPEGKVPLDIDLVNNSKSSAPSNASASKVALKVLHWIQNILLTTMVF